MSKEDFDDFHTEDEAVGDFYDTEDETVEEIVVVEPVPAGAVVRLPSGMITNKG